MRSTSTIQDLLTRYHHLRGYNTLWLVGTDHAGIATQNKVEAQLADEGLRKEDLGREAFEERVWEWRRQYGSTIIHQLKRLGCACDYERSASPWTTPTDKAVLRVFVDLYRRATSTATCIWSTGARAAGLPSPTWRWSTWTARTSSTTSGTRWRRTSS